MTQSRYEEGSLRGKNGNGNGNDAFRSDKLAMQQIKLREKKEFIFKPEGTNCAIKHFLKLFFQLNVNEKCLFKFQQRCNQNKVSHSFL